MSQSLNPRSAADLAKLNKLAEERQAALDKREKELNNRVSEQAENLKFSDARLLYVNGQIEKAEKKLTAAQATMSADEGELKLKLKELTTKVDEKKAELAPVNQLINSRKIDLKEVERQIKERQDYLSKQEIQVEVVIAGLNDTLRELTSESAKLTIEKEGLLRQNHDLQVGIERSRGDLGVLNDEITQQGNKLDDLTTLYETTAAKYKEKLQEERRKYQIVAESTEGKTAELEAREKAVSITEKSLAIRVAALKQGEKDLEAARRKLESDLSLL